MSDPYANDPSSAPPPGSEPQPSGPSSPGTHSQPGATDTKILAAVSYIPIVGLILYFVQRDLEVRFHAAQSVLIAVVSIVVQIGLQILGAIALGLVFSLLALVVSLATLVVLIIGAVQAYGRNHWKLPVLGDMAEQWAQKPTGARA